MLSTYTGHRFPVLYCDAMVYRNVMGWKIITFKVFLNIISLR